MARADQGKGRGQVARGAVHAHLASLISVWYGLPLSPIEGSFSFTLSICWSCSVPHPCRLLVPFSELFNFSIANSPSTPHPTSTCRAKPPSGMQQCWSRNNGFCGTDFATLLCGTIWGHSIGGIPSPTTSLLLIVGPRPRHCVARICAVRECASPRRRKGGQIASAMRRACSDGKYKDRASFFDLLYHLNHNNLFSSIHLLRFLYYPADDREVLV